ncbi:MAG: 1-deoxy-D-xylulose-5-phosphate synthase [Chloroflexi bacterium]|nr:MAG: 1-deoxy-D-xylulose-5-phosphate synthase [Chloroflexota bacterium]RLC95112.1 MAG: 1-deoxy-D-xylulose-5-phosphate synthase [Chloroflexota bacterium]
MSERGRILDEVSGPADLKRLSRRQLKRLAADIRDELIARVEETGGHLASNLGVVELSIALHRVFDTPEDKIVWDVGHQCYVHKMLTGRRQSLRTLRQYGGISGFPTPDESPHDPFGTGHASTSISAALGLAKARDLAGEKYHVIAVIGDGALTGGMAFEGLNHAGQLATRLIVVLNDNGMAISPSVGALARVLNRLRLDARLRWPEKGMEEVITRLPLGRQVGKRVKMGVKGVLMPRVTWEELGFAYLGPIDGHNMAALEAALRQARNYKKGPVFLHVITTKGKGYDPAEKDAITFHGLAGNGSTDNRPSYSSILGQTVLRIAREDPRVVVITAAMLEGTGLAPVARELPKRVFDVGICEQHAVTFAAGLAVQGFVPIVAIYSTFLQRAFDQLVHDVCIQRLPVAFVIDRGGIVPDDGKTHQGTFDISYLGCIPNLIVSAPKDENELQHLVYTAVRANAPMAVRYPKGPGPGAALDEELREIPIGQGEVLSEGKDVALVALGAMVSPALEAAEELEKAGVKCTVINARFAKPLDSNLILDAAEKTGRLVTLEENTLVGGFGSAVLQLLQRYRTRDVQVRCVGLPDIFIEHGSQAVLRSIYGLDAQGIVRRVLGGFPEFSRAAKRRDPVGPSAS